MASIHEVQFPPQIALGATGGPAFRTEIVTLKSGLEVRNQDWTRARGRWDIGTALKSATDYATVIAFHYARRGRAFGFRFKDWSDYQATGQVLIASCVGGETSAQLIKTYTDAGGSYARTINKPVSGTVTVYDDGSPIGGATVNTVTGVVSFSARTAGHAITADFQFDVPVRFEQDDLRLQLAEFDAAHAPSVPLVELRCDSDGQG